MVSLPPPNLDVNDDAALFGNHDVQFNISAQKAFYRSVTGLGWVDFDFDVPPIL